MRIEELRDREVINISTGRRLGYVSDADIDIASGRVLALVVPGPYKFFGLFGRGEDVVLPWDCIVRIGDDILLVEERENHPPLEHETEKTHFYNKEKKT